MHALDRMEEALIEIPKVREDMGYPPLVTPLSQMVGNQAVTNVLMGERYKGVSNEIKAYLRGEYGKAPGTVNEEVRKKILGDEKPIEGRFADTLAPGLEKGKEEIGDLARSEEDVLSYIAFPQQAQSFFEKRKADEEKVVKYTIRQED